MRDTISLKQVIAHARGVYENLEPQVQKRAAELKTTCTKGCAACCYQLVGCTFVEALIITEELFRTRTREQVDALLVMLDHQTELLRREGDARFDMFLEKRHCPLLVLDEGGDPYRGLCSVYDSRPLACRLQYVVSDPRLCQPDKIYECAVMDTSEAQHSAMRMISGEVPTLIAYAPLQPLLAHAIRVIRRDEPLSDEYLQEWQNRMLGFLDHERSLMEATGKKDISVL